MSQAIKTLASDFDTFLKGVVPAGVTTPAVLPGASSVEAAAEEEEVEPTTNPEALVRAAWDYISSKVEESEGPDVIGQSFMLAVSALSQDTNVPLKAMQKAAINFLEAIVDSARESV